MDTGNGSGSVLEVAAGIDGAFPQLFFNPEQLIILGDPF